jgi:tetraacyldisaccharide 4'-kinase
MFRDIEINVTDARRLYGNGLCLPAGPLREPRSRLNSVDYLVYNISRGKLQSAALAANAYTMSYKLTALKSVADTQLTMTLDDFKGKIVHAVAAIGEPDAFFRQLKQHGLQIIEHPFPDHYQFEEGNLDFSDELPVIMTQKDAVKCQSFALKNAWYLPVQADIDAHFFVQIHQQLQSAVINRKKTY